MSTEYRRGIPSTAHIEAATRLGLEWEEVRTRRNPRRWRFQIRGGELWCDFRSDVSDWDRDLEPLSSGRIADRTDIEHYTFRPIRPDGTLVDWEVLDQEVARVGRQGQPQGFRADLWARICIHFSASMLDRSIKDVVIADATEGLIVQGRLWAWRSVPIERDRQRADILARWTVYQELKPLYDLVDGAQGEAAMPRDVEAEWDRQSLGSAYNFETDGDWVFGRDSLGVFARSAESDVWRADPSGSQASFRNFAAVLDAVAERRVAVRQAGQTLRQQLAELPQAVQAERAADEARRLQMEARLQSGPPAQLAQPEPRRFADVRPDRHGWRWWRQTGRDSTDLGQRFETQNGRCRWRSAHADAWFVPDTANPQMLRYTVIPTDEQGNPVSWESIEQERSAGQTAPTVTGRTATLIYVDDITTQAPSAQELRTAWDSINKTLPLPIQPPLLPRFTADELDDVDHSKTTKLDEVTLRRGKLPTVEQIAKYREVRARRTGGTVANALKESRIDCEVAQYVLERWAGGLGDELALWLLRAVGKYSRSDLRFTQRSVDELAQHELTHEAGAIETAEPSPTVQWERQEAEERRQRLAQLRQRLAAERAAQPQEMAKESEASRFDLIEPDPQADPSASIRAWEARQAAAKVRPVAAPPRIAKPAAARRPAIEVVDAEVDGLSRSEAFVALVGRAFNGGC